MKLANKAWKVTAENKAQKDPRVQPVHQALLLTVSVFQARRARKVPFLNSYRDNNSAGDRGEQGQTGSPGNDGIPGEKGDRGEPGEDPADFWDSWKDLTDDFDDYPNWADAGSGAGLVRLNTFCLLSFFTNFYSGL